MKQLPKSIRARELTARAVGWSVYASAVWAAIGRHGLEENAATLTIPLILAAVFSVASGASAFAVALFLRARGETCVAEVLYGIVARTGVFCVIALAFVASLDRETARTGLKLLLLAYFATAPLHVAAIFPTTRSNQDRKLGEDAENSEDGEDKEGADDGEKADR